MATFDDRWRGLHEFGDGLGTSEDDSPAERAATRTRRSVQPDGGRREGKATKIASAAGIALGRLGTGLIDSAIRGVMAPGNAYRSTPDNPVTTEDMVGPAFDLASTLMGGAPGTAQAGAVGIFGGRLARTADLSALARAERMAAEGASRDAIWNETGWFQGADKKWRFEIDDSGAKLSPGAGEAFDGPGASAKGNLDQVLSHSPVFDAYPQLRKVSAEVSRSDGPTSGMFDRPSNQILAEGATPGDVRSVLLHEGQHGVQAAEGFARGGNPGAPGMLDLAHDVAQKAANDYAHLSNQMRAFQDDFAARNGITRGDMDYHAWMRTAAREWQKAFPEDAAALDQAFRDMDFRGGTAVYRRLAGEAEARNVQKRRDMTPDERRATPPWVTEDVPTDKQILRFHEEGPQASRLLDPYQTNFNVLDQADVFKRIAQKRRDQGLGNGGPGSKMYPSAKARAAAEGYTAPEKGSWDDLVQRTKAQWDHDKSAARADYQAASNPLMSADDLAFIDSPEFSLFAGAADKRSAAAISGTRAAADRGPLDHAKLVRLADKIAANQGGFRAVPIAEIVRETGLPPRVVHDALLREARAGNVTLHPTTVAWADYPAAERAAWLKLSGHDAPLVTFSVLRREPQSLDDLDELLRAYRSGRSGRDADTDPLASILDGSK